MRTQLLPVSAAAAIGLMLLAGTTKPVLAHHGFAAEYDGAKPVTLKGKIVSFQWINPHSWLHFNVQNPDGTVTEWAVEFGSVSSLLRRGYRYDDLPVGVDVTVKGYLARNGAKAIGGASVTMADGKTLFSGNGPGAEGDR